MSGKGKKARRTSNIFTSKKRTRKAANKPQSPRTSYPPSHKLLNAMDNTGHKEMTESSGLTEVIDFLIDISSCLEATEHGMEPLKAGRTSAVSRQSQSPSTSQPAAHAGRGHSHNRAERDHLSQHRATPALLDLAEAVRDNVAKQMRQILVLEVSTIDKHSLSEEELIPMYPKKNALKSGKLRTVDSLVLHRVVWPHAMVYMVMSQLAVYDDISIALFVSRYMLVM